LAKDEDERLCVALLGGLGLWLIQDEMGKYDQMNQTDEGSWSLHIALVCQVFTMVLIQGACLPPKFVHV